MDLSDLMPHGHEIPDYVNRTGIKNYSPVELCVADKTGMLSILPAVDSSSLYAHTNRQPRIEITTGKGTSNTLNLKFINTSKSKESIAYSAEMQSEYERHKNRNMGMSFYARNDRFSGGITYNYSVPDPGTCIVDERLGILIAREAEIFEHIRRRGFWPRDALTQINHPKLDDSLPSVLHSTANLLSAKIVVVDTKHRFDSIWTTVFGSPMRIPVTREGELEDGIYIDVSITGNNTGHATHIPFDEELGDKMKEYNLHTCLNDAINHQTTKQATDAAAQIKKLKEELSKKNKELDKVNKDLEMANLDAKLLKANRTANIVLDVAKFIGSPQGAWFVGGLTMVAGWFGFTKLKKNN